MSLEVRTCAACGATDAMATRFDAGTFQMLQCRLCGMMSQAGKGLPPAVDPYGQVYASMAKVQTLDDLLSDRCVREPYAIILEGLRAAGVSGGRLLDIGCGCGPLVAMANHQGWVACGIDLSADAVRWARAQGLDCRLVPVETFIPDALFDAIVFRHVLEHLQDPLATLEIVSRWLASDGVIYIEVPNADSRLLRADRLLKGHLKPFEHLHYFGPPSLRALCRRAGLDGAVRAEQRYSLAELLDCWVRGTFVLRASWLAMRYPGKSSAGSWRRITETLYQGAKTGIQRLRIGPRDKVLTAFMRRVPAHGAP